MSTIRRALIAEDEPILATMLCHALKRLWPSLQIDDIAVNGQEAVNKALQQKPDILFLDIKMPGKTGLEAAQELVEEWPSEEPFPLLVFVTAYDEYAVQAFDLAAVDYLLKPINDTRLQRAIDRLQIRLDSRNEEQSRDAAKTTAADLGLQRLDPALLQLVQSLQVLLPNAAPAQNSDTLRFIKVASGNQVKMIPIENVIYFEAVDKYVNVVSLEGEALIRTSLRELLAQLDSKQFWQIHRSSIVNSSYVLAAIRDESGKISIRLRERAETLRVSPVYAHLFKQM